ncbi:hypothetical protein MUK42_17747 [Musa troglodytarum]|uniref:Uncharacterized protein n=1 Tax=Musa troglodytarum TaxID=320322 RepID=A0A9E7GQX9_9LILI|nr:hypothetical protein MUK42_17747 [Musa troglodytarum]
MIAGNGGKGISRAYDKNRNKTPPKHRALNVLLVAGDCILVGLQPILVYMSKVDGSFKFSPISVNFLTEAAKVLFAIIMLVWPERKGSARRAVRGARRREATGEAPQRGAAQRRRLSRRQAAQPSARSPAHAAIARIAGPPAAALPLTPHFLYFNPATVKMLSNLKWEALALLLIGISVNQLKSLPEDTNALGLPVAMGAYLYTLMFVTVPSLASVFNEYALKSQFDTSIYLQNLFLYGYGAIFNFIAIVGTAVLKDTILKKYSSTVATIFTGIASAALFGHTLTINFILGISIVFISMHQFFSPLAKAKDDMSDERIEMMDAQDVRLKEASYVNMTPGATKDASHPVGPDERRMLLCV